MGKSSVLHSRVQLQEIGIYGNKSSLALFWLLTRPKQVQKQGFSINELARDAEISVGQVHKVIKQLEFDGIVKAMGLRTSKRFYLHAPDKLLVDWLGRYQVLKRVKSRGFALTSQPNAKLLQSLQRDKIVPALHTSCRVFFEIKTTNIKSEEFYLNDWESLSKVTTSLRLQELERGYEILFLDPYYSALVSRMLDESYLKKWKASYEILTFLDLCHYPLRGLEEAEVLFRKSSVLKTICSWKDIEDACR